MRETGIEDAEAGPDEAGFLMQLRPPPAADADALAAHVDLFTARFLTASAPDTARFARIDPLTWALAAPAAERHGVQDAALSLGGVLFGPDVDAVRLIERSAAPEPAAPDNDAGEDWQMAAPEPLDLDADDIDLDSLIEPPARASAPDVASELAAFRAEMRAIARAIPDAAGHEREALADFRREMTALTDAAGDRIDAAAGRIESCAAGLPEAAARVEASAALMETSVREALEALTRACAAMSAGKASPGRTA
ncbi:hypothetical protein F1654_13745 [Alkalicaulis satelles]|uniref:Uncharacterized protein n=1 Tax=Alkalicaulis satelles TaxID=2609175 RepID=A0A5M6ZCU2_9PROT|nr:hypothetical protein [Alkalicaulis satelles]KAA5800898.1 hypothetical protein F1654_13745 [Alkalicaulis satelles]